MAIRRWFFAPLLFSLISEPASGASLEAPPHPPVQAARAAGAIRCDGILDEPSWAQAPPASALYQQTPEQGAAATMKSEFKVLFDDEALYSAKRAGRNRVCS